jgi:uncharacterized membrane protein
MIQAHVLDSWTRLDARGTWQFSWAMVLAGFAAPLFLFCAGFSVVLSAASNLRRHGDASAAARAVMKRGWWLLVLALVFRVQAWILGWSHDPAALLKVDILNVMGPSIIAAAAIWGLVHRKQQPGLCIAFGAVALAIALGTPAVRASTALDVLPDPLENYLRPPRGSNWFSIFPWAGFLFAGAIPGVLVSSTQSRDEEARLNGWFAGAALATAAVAYAASFFPSIVGPSTFWDASPAFFLIRTGALTMAIPLGYWWNRAIVRDRWSPLQQMGRSSLFIYWIHVEMVYGLISLRIHKSLTHPQAWAAFAAFAIVMLGCSLLKERVAGMRRGGRDAGRGLATGGMARGISPTGTTKYMSS